MTPTLIVQYCQCVGREDLPFADFTEQALAKQPDSIIVDLRENTGATSSLFHSLVEAAKRFVSVADSALIGPATSSPAVMNAYVPQRPGCTLHGEPTGGSVTRSGQAVVLERPNTRLPPPGVSRNSSNTRGSSARSGNAAPDRSAEEVMSAAEQRDLLPMQVEDDQARQHHQTREPK